MKYCFFSALFIILFIQGGCTTLKVSTAADLQKVQKKIQPGDIVLMSNGIWKNQNIIFKVNGTKDKPVTLIAENPGSVILTEGSALLIAGDYIVVDGLYFKNGPLNAKSIIQFSSSSSHCILQNNCVHGAIAGNRNLVELVQAMQFTPENFNLILLGEGPVRERLKEITDRLCLQNKIAFYDAVSYKDVPGYLKSADVGVVPIPDTLWFKVSMPIKLLEYMAMGLPIVAPSTEPVNYVTTTKADISYYQLNTDNLAKEMAKALNNAFERWGKNYYSSTNRDLVISRFIWEVQAQNIGSFFKSFK